MVRPFRLLPLCAVALIALAGCESDEDQAERHFQSALELVAAGDIDRAMVAFSNVFRHDGFHREARETYAALLVDLGDTGQATSQYLRLVEQYPDSPDARRTLAELAIARADWQEAERHGRAALDLTPEDPAVRAIGIALDYRTAIVDRDDTARAAAAARAEELRAQLPDNAVIRQVVIDSRMVRDDLTGALEEVERALAADGEDFDMHRLKLNLLARLDDGDGVGLQLREMFARFPEREDVRATLIDWYLARGDTAGAEGFLRELAGEATADPQAHAAVVQFLGSTQGVEAARDELARLIAAAAGHPNADAYRTMLAEIDFAQGEAAEAIAALEAVLAEAEPGEQTRRIRVTLARMLEAMGEDDAALAQVETVLAEDATHVEALRLRAAQAIRRDRPEAAILDLRTALGQEPRDAGLLTLMAQAHERNGARELAGEMLSRAVEVSNRAPAESLRYARFLQRAGRMAAAEGILADALQGAPGNVRLLEAMADLHLANRDWTRARESIQTLRALGTPAALAAAEQIEAALLVGEGSLDEGIALLEDMVERSDGDVTVTAAAVMQGHLRAGRPEAARAYIDDLLAERSSEPLLRMLSAGLHAAMNEVSEAEALLRAVMADTPTLEAAPQMLYGLLTATGRPEDALAVLDAALAQQPDSDTLLSLKAENRLRANDYEAAIEIYDRLYARNPDNVALANNLASLLTSFRSDPESLARGHSIARRLRGIPVPAFQDTYGWIEYRRGNYAEALTHLEPAATALPGDPLIQFHLGMTYAALERTDEAIEHLTLALDLAGDSPLPQFAEARTRLSELTGN
jgi:tetratricopeptide (TPR) repeat protein